MKRKTSQTRCFKMGFEIRIVPLNLRNAAWQEFSDEKHAS